MVDNNISFLYSYIMIIFYNNITISSEAEPLRNFLEFFIKPWGTGEKCQGSKTCKKHKVSVHQYGKV